VTSDRLLNLTSFCGCNNCYTTVLLVVWSQDECFLAVFTVGLPSIYTVIHNYGNPYEKWNIFVAWPLLWLNLGMVKPEIMLCETVRNLSTLRYHTISGNVTSRHRARETVELLKMETQISFLLGPGCKSGRLQSVVSNAGEGLLEADQGH